MKLSRDEKIGIVVSSGGLGGVVLFAAWLTHVIVCFKAGLWGFLIAGAIFFPVAIVHGIGIWLRAW
jgi:hypothetical protein